LKNFGLFCFCSFLVGITNAALQQIRFAAMECVELKKATSAASAVLLSGVGAAFIGPELAVWGRDITAVEYQGSFWLVSMCSVAAALVLSVYSPAELRENDAAVVARPLSQMLQTPAFVLAVASGAVAYVVMTFIMTGTPISMHNHFGHSLVDTKWVIQSHIAAMFLPSLLSPWLVKLFGLRGMMMMGLTCYGVTIIVGNIDTSVMGFWTQLVLLGIGWNFLFVAGTAMLSSCYLPGEQYKAQSFNDGVVFSIQALASLSAGWVMSVASWQSTLLICLLPVIFMIAILLWNQRTTKFSLG
jgi:predicted MFS family arabinose efflux permease